jgi:4-amino-4-deoxy-L-arabinose transferase-like glycosyltransferase
MLPRVPVVLLTALGAFLRFFYIGHQGFWYDESYTVFLVKHGSGTMLGLIPQLESTPPLYYLITWAWARIFGFSPAALKSLSALFGTLTIPVAYAATRKLLESRRAALILTALVACNPLLIWYSQETRAYELMVLTCALTLWAFAYALEDPRPKLMALWALACAVALVTHYYAVIAVVPEAVWLLYRHRRARAVYGALAAVAATGFALLPLALTQNRTGNNSWIANSSYLLRLRQVPGLFLLGPQTHLHTLLELLALATVALASVLVVREARGRERRGAFLAGGLALAGFLIAAGPGYNTFLGRNLLPLLLPAAIFLAAGLGAARRRLLGLGATALLCAIGVTAVLSVDTTYAFQRPNWALVAAAFGRWPAAGQSRRDGRIIVVQYNPGILPLDLYLPDLRYAKQSTLRRITEIDVVAALPHSGLGGFCWWGSECNLVPSRLDRHYKTPGFHVVARRRVHNFGILELRARRPMTVRLRQVAVPVRRRAADGRLYVPTHAQLHDAMLVQQA